MDRLHIAVVSSSNIIRSMEAHGYLRQKGYNVKSYGTGKMIALPDITTRHENYYYYGDSYEFIINDLQRVSHDYAEISQILRRNMDIKSHPEKFQDNKEIFDIIVTCETLVYYEVLDWFKSRVSSGTEEHPVYVVNLNVGKAVIGSVWIVDLLTLLVQSTDLERDALPIIDQFQKDLKQPSLRSKLYY